MPKRKQEPNRPSARILAPGACRVDIPRRPLPKPKELCAKWFFDEVDCLFGLEWTDIVVPDYGETEFLAGNFTPAPVAGEERVLVFAAANGCRVATALEVVIVAAACPAFLGRVPLVAPGSFVPFDGRRWVAAVTSDYRGQLLQARDMDNVGVSGWRILFARLRQQP